ncbi:RtcB family protein [Larkinella knui]|nr:RtcB family protein [Larkinella knui]
MPQPGFIVRAGRKMARTAAKNSLTWSQVQDVLNQKGITLIGEGFDEAPMAYKDIDQVMRFQRDMVDVVGRFQPKDCPDGCVRAGYSVHHKLLLIRIDHLLTRAL